MRARTGRSCVSCVTPTTSDLGADETLLLLAPLAFDASTFEIWGSRCSTAAGS